MDVAAIQRALGAHGYATGPVDGDAGPLTLAALEAFQRGAGLVPDGIAGPRTRAALAAGPAPSPAAGEPRWLTLARAELGIREGAGQANEPKVLAYFRDAGFPGIRADSTAWCAAFVGAMLARAALAPSGSLAARAYERWGVGLPGPRLGCVGVKRRGTSAGRGTSWQGHVGFVVAANPARIVMLGGNQGDRVSVAGFARRDFTAFRWPAGLPPPVSTALPATVAGARTGLGEA